MLVGGDAPSAHPHPLDELVARGALDAAGKIERVGPDKGGYWKVLGQSAA